MSNLKAFLDMLAFSEIGPVLLAKSDNGYNVIVGGQLFSDHGTPDNLFDDYSDHPRKIVDLGRGLKSSAAGRYQILIRNYDFYKRILNLPDFSPASQDAIATQLIKERRAFADIENGKFDSAVAKVSNIWASLPGAGYGQHENKISALRTAYEIAGGTFS